MTDASIAAGGGDTRKSLLRVWLAISATWVAFWLLIAAAVFAAASTRNPFLQQLPIFAAIVLLPPLGLLGIGALIRLLIETFLRPTRA